MLLKFLRSLARINLLIEPTIRHYVVYARAWYWIRLRRRLRTLDSDDTVKANIMHNMKSIWGVNNRMNLLTYPLSVIETLGPDARILVIGPRNENDLLSLAGLGFRKENIVGLDLISYSPHIHLGDMHAIPFPDASFDAVICGWTISYSTNPRRAADEMVRVTKPGGVLAIGVEYSTMEPRDEKVLLGYELQEFEKIGRRLNSARDFRELFAGSMDHVYFEHDAPRKISHTAEGLVDRVSNVGIVFSIKQGG
ncbi:class I SAM-dependent methyltransferase [Phenylobacterium sp.]|uniref:class I SAM-dependent methyltransferase n=1 Tax=Phenylobacterium sp. TaxID=1871053 RepID=UPI0028124E8C|nr:class I SAM-dependent methyltransferase [Phenylobacterium sp.]